MSTTSGLGSDAIRMGALPLMSQRGLMLANNCSNVCKTYKLDYLGILFDKFRKNQLGLKQAPWTLFRKSYWIKLKQIVIDK